ncbi:MAG TPA: PilZ domain-containing protein [Kofleriaceae bacterium]|nr:PilZ domain-containing protein [Kofleriaceae bacterium]
MPQPIPPPPPRAEDRRQSERVELLAQIELRRGGAEVVLLPVLNISAGGVFLRIDGGALQGGLRVGDQVGVFLDCGEDVTLDVDAEVVRVDLMGSPGRPAGIALMWASADPAFAENLTRALRVVAR